MPDRVLVTGAGGFIGGRLAMALGEAGWDVTAADLREIPSTVRERSRALRGDYRDTGLLRRIRAGEFDAVVHQAAISNTLELDRHRLNEVNVEGSLALAEAALSGDATFIYASSFSVYGRITKTVPVKEHAVDDARLCSGPLNPYAESKLALDRAMAGFAGRGLRWAGLRYTNVFAAGEELGGRASSIIAQIVTMAAQGRPISLFADTMTASRDYVPVAAVCAAVQGLLRNDFQPGVYNLGAGHAVSFATLIRWCEELDARGSVNVQLIPNPIPDRYQYWTCADISKLAAALPGLGAVRPEAVHAEVRRVYDYARRDADRG
jgi:ADP-L-glycero-D-manno-heptose 6-epimerase